MKPINMPLRLGAIQSTKTEVPEMPASKQKPVEIIRAYQRYPDEQPKRQLQDPIVPIDPLPTNRPRLEQTKPSYSYLDDVFEPVIEFLCAVVVVVVEAAVG